MKRQGQDWLLKEIFGGDDLTDCRQVTLESGLRALRRQRARRRALLGCAVASVPLMVVLAFHLNRPLGPIVQRDTPSKAMVATRDAPRPERHEVSFITDEELFALFPNRPMALIGKAGQQELVFLDRKTP